MAESGSGEERGFHAGRAARLALLVAALLIAFTAFSFHTPHAGRVGYGWATLAGGVALGLFGLGIRQGFTWCAYPAALVLGAFDFVWMVRILEGFDVGLAIWIGICFFSIREIWPGVDGKFPWIKRNP